jgi:hypothetical protein
VYTGAWGGGEINIKLGKKYGWNKLKNEKYVT